MGGEYPSHLTENAIRRLNMLPNHWYSTQPFLAWVINHYFYRARHYCWVATPFYPYQLKNPRSSRPMDLYRDYYEPWKERDVFSDFLAGKRTALGNGVRANKGILTTTQYRSLRKICRAIDVQFLYPIVYRVDLNPIDLGRLVVSGSGLTGSQEYLIEVLQEHEFDIMLFNPAAERLGTDIEILWNNTLAPHEVLALLERWC